MTSVAGLILASGQNLGDEHFVFACNLGTKILFSNLYLSVCMLVLGGYE